MTLQSWLREQVDRLEREIRGSALFDGDAPASQEELLELRRKVAIHAFLAQELRRRDERRRMNARTREVPLPRWNDTRETPLPIGPN